MVLDERGRDVDSEQMAELLGDAGNSVSFRLFPLFLVFLESNQIDCNDFVESEVNLILRKPCLYKW